MLLVEGQNTDYSQVLTHHCLMGRFLPAVFPPWANASLIIQPCHIDLHQCYNIDTKLDVDTCST